MPNGERRFIDAVEPILRYMPTVPRPKEALGMGSRLLWTFLAITVYLLMSITPLYGLSKTSFFASPAIAAILGISFGTLSQLGITPIVVAGIILEILVFSDMINIDMEDPEDQAKFNALLKLLSLALGLLEAIALVVSGQLVPFSPGFLYGSLIVLQLFLATVIIVLMDDMISKGWGLGSGISLFILVTIIRQMFAEAFTPFIPTGATMPLGVIPALATAIYYALGGQLSYLMNILYQTNLPSLTGLIATVALALIVLYLELMEVSIPVALVQYRGYRFSVPLKLMYVSVLPIIFTAYTVYLIGEGLTLVWSAYNRANASPLLNLIACAHVGPTGQLIPCPNSLLYYFTVVPPNINVAYIAVHIVMYAVLSMVFAMVWVSLAGLSAEDQARYIIQGGMQIPGFRTSPKVIARFLDRYIRILTIVSGLIVGIIAALGDIAGVFGGGIGLILVVEIIIQYYSLALQEQLFEIYPGLKRLIGKE